MYEFFKAMLPVRQEVEAGTCTAAFGSVFCYFLGGWSSIIEALIVLMAVDYLTGLCAAYLSPEIKLSSRIGLRGIIKKLMILCLVVLAHQLDAAAGQGGTIIRDIVVLFFIGNEGLSILENAAKCGLPIPDRLKKSLAQFTQDKKNKEVK